MHTSDLFARGARVILSGRNEAALAAVSKAAGDRALLLPFEATDFERIGEIAEGAWRWAQARSGGIYGLVNNAGISQRSLAVESKFEVYRRVIDVDLLAPIALTQSAFRSWQGCQRADSEKFAVKRGHEVGF